MSKSPIDDSSNTVTDDEQTNNVFLKATDDNFPKPVSTQPPKQTTSLVTPPAPNIPVPSKRQDPPQQAYQQDRFPRDMAPPMPLSEPSRRSYSDRDPSSFYVKREEYPMREMPREFSRDVPREMSRDMGREMNREMPREMSRDMGRDMMRMPRDYMQQPMMRDMQRSEFSDRGYMDYDSYKYPTEKIFQMYQTQFLTFGACVEKWPEISFLHYSKRYVQEFVIFFNVRRVLIEIEW